MPLFFSPQQYQKYFWIDNGSIPSVLVSAINGKLPKKYLLNDLNLEKEMSVCGQTMTLFGKVA
jgi:hypothetical protein